MIGSIRLWSINRVLGWLGLVLIVDIDDQRVTGAVEFRLSTWRAFIKVPGRAAKTEGEP